MVTALSYNRTYFVWLSTKMSNKRKKYYIQINVDSEIKKGSSDTHINWSVTTFSRIKMKPLKPNDNPKKIK